VAASKTQPQKRWHLIQSFNHSIIGLNIEC
jgi:hypothetical protein